MSEEKCKGKVCLINHIYKKCVIGFDTGEHYKKIYFIRILNQELHSSIQEEEPQQGNFFLNFLV